MTDYEFINFLDELRGDRNTWKREHRPRLYVMNRLVESITETAGDESEESFTASQIQKVFDLIEEEHAWIIKFQGAEPISFFGTREQAKKWAMSLSDQKFILL